MLVASTYRRPLNMNMLITKQINELNGSKALEDSPLDLHKGCSINIRICTALKLTRTLWRKLLPILMKIFVLKFNSNTRKAGYLQRNKMKSD